MSDKIKEKLDEIEKLANEATDGPWEYDIDTDIGLAIIDNGERVIIEDDFSLLTDDRNLVAEIIYPYKKDFPFIAASRTLVPKLIEALRVYDAQMQVVEEHSDDKVMRQGATMARNSVDEILGET